MLKIKIISNVYANNLEQDVNTFTKTHNVKNINVFPGTNWVYAAITYEVKAE